MKYCHVFADADGTARIEEIQFETEPDDLVNGAPLSTVTTSSQVSDKSADMQN